MKILLAGWFRSSRTSRPDLVFLSDTPPVPVVGICNVEPHPDGLTDLTDPAIDSLLDVRHAAVVAMEALDYCLTEEARALARECADRARLLVDSLDAAVRREIAAVE